ncbi:MAG TPA: hypothetical protein VGQ91_14635 [Ideonella sp.]|nr:hypothetical protein [Ideonella sp.]
MVQAALAFNDLPLPPIALAGRRRALPPLQTEAQEARFSAEQVDPGFQLGWDYAHHGLVPPAEHLLPGHPLRQGWEAGRVTFGRRTLKASRHVQQWLQLRLAAWQGGQAFEGVQVTPNFLAQIDSPRCPVTRSEFADGAEAAIERLNHRAGYAAGNLVCLSTRAQQAKGGRRWDEARLMAVLAESRQGDAHGGVAEGLCSAEWARLATLQSFVTPLPHEIASALPLRVLPPNRLRLVNPIQGLQALITLQLTHHGFAVRIAQLTGLLPGAALRRDFHLFFHTLLPRAGQGGRPSSAPKAASGARPPEGAKELGSGPSLLGLQALRERLEDAWADPVVLRRWQRFAGQLNAEQADQLLRKLVSKGLAAGMGRRAEWHPAARTTEGWALESAGAA